jgi:shikimate kinase
VNQSVFLVGPMGSGKTTIGKVLASELRLNFYDSDKFIEERCGANIPWIFDMEGEEGFREREVQAIDQLTSQPGILLATGGGAVLREENRQRLSARGLVVYLRTSVEQQVLRTAKDRNRPLLQAEDPAAVLEALFIQRDPLYQDVADIIIDTDRNNPRWVVSELKKRIKAKSL